MTKKTHSRMGCLQTQQVDNQRGGHLAKSPATWSQHRRTPSLYHHLMNLKSWLPLLGFHLPMAWCYDLATLFVGILMGMGWTKSQSHHLSRHGGFRPVSWSAKAHSSPWPPKSWPPPDFGVVLLSGSSFYSALGPQHPTSLH
jgi:hypothetical protein